tara:strand:+ start:5198 stop:5866 length:669 start_codon:yes stop_codon:yes gene_type:complete
MKSFQEFITEGPQGVADYSTSGTEGGSYKSFKKRPRTGLGSALKGAAKGAVQSIKNAGKNTAGSEQKRKPAPYRMKNKEATPKPEKGGALAKTKKTTSDVIKTAAKTAAKTAVKSRPMLGTAQRGDIKKKLAGTPQRKALKPGSSSITKRPESKPATQSGIKPVRVTVLGPKRAGYIGSGDKKKVTGSGSQKALSPSKNNQKVTANTPNKNKPPQKQLAAAN